MIPVSLALSGFLSYRDPAEIDFSSFDLACIAGRNGAGKSSLLDAITWALFGQARQRGEALINQASPAAEVSFTFEYEGNIYRVQRSLPRGKTTLLEFHLQQSASPRPTWKPLTERSLRETQARIEQTLRLDYDTFVNASFFLQGKADQFTQQPPAERKRILASILGLESWEAYRERAAARRKAVEDNIRALEGRLAEIVAELAEEQPRKAQLAALSQQLDLIQASRRTQEKSLDAIRQTTAALNEQRKLADSLARQVEAASRRLNDLMQRAAARQQERDACAQLLARADQIHAAYQAWQAARAELEQWETIAAQFRQYDKRRQPFLDALNAARARLVQEQETLLAQQRTAQAQQAALGELRNQAAELQSRLAQAETTLAQRADIQAQLNEALTHQAEAKAENPRLKAEMEELNQRKLQLAEVEGAACPVCGKPLSPQERQSMIEAINAQGKEKADRYRANQALLKEMAAKIGEYQARLDVLAAVEQERNSLAQTLAGLAARIEQSEQHLTTWQNEGLPRLQQVTASLQAEDFAADTRQKLAELDAELKAIGYDAAAHDDARRREVAGRAADAELRALERAQAALEPLQRELADLESARQTQQAELEHLQADYQAAASALAAAQAAAPDLYAAEQELLTLQEQENRLRLEVGAAKQKVDVLDDLRLRHKGLQTQREELARLTAQYKQLERAFGKDGVPALLIEQALPQIEARANELLDRLSGGNMSVRFVTQAAFKDKKRPDLKETLDIQISDSAGSRDYEMFSGGEAFRINFAIRLALSEVLAQRAGARLQTLVIDEGFGSQDAEGRQRLVEAINLVRTDFAKILIITHIDELRDAFPTRIEVTKSERGSMVRVV